MMHQVMLFGLATFVAVATSAEDDQNKKDLAAFQGNWAMAALEIDGKQTPDDKLKETTLTIKGNRYIVKTGGSTYEMTFELDASKKPRTIDMMATEGVNKDKVHHGIYVIEKDTFKMCRGLSPEAERPREFGTWPDSGIFLVTWKKQ